ncbi:MAG: hypothetical protein ACLUHA_17295, partial [Bacteroides stercoris]
LPTIGRMQRAVDESFNYQPMNRVIVGAWYNDPKGLDLRAEYGHIGSSKDGRDIIKEDGFYALAGWHAGKFLRWYVMISIVIR